MTAFRRYIALGDSISIDLYPARDLQAADPERCGPELRPALGAASLFHLNDDEIWPEFRGRDLSTLVPEIRFRNNHGFGGPSSYPSDNLTTDGATITGTLQLQLPNVERNDEPTVVTMTVGGNDLLQGINTGEDPTPQMIAHLPRLLEELFRRRPNATVLLGTVYDPSDGTRCLGGQHLPEQHRWLVTYNAAIREVVAGDERIRLADIEHHFLGHGERAEDRWYWSGLIFEPNARGASEVRRIWLETLGL
jgi:lysophospholipase L1-like esterase